MKNKRPKKEETSLDKKDIKQKVKRSIENIKPHLSDISEKIKEIMRGPKDGGGFGGPLAPA